MEFRELSSIKGHENEFSELLIDSIESGASIGFITPVNHAEISTYWNEVEVGLALAKRKLFAVFEGNELVACVQLSLCAKANGAHRAEVEKLMVKTTSRGQGISKKLMKLMECVAVEIGLTLLVLDTRVGDLASNLYRSIGYIEAGKIPQFALGSNVKLESTVYFYKLLTRL
ncbi:GNAT family N-acetyltransferase [Marinomonas sp. PE14-40]|uniref:GNAT family N-acetyltransferase n=1 Tax=Marinomonas sp. PE14-40 TaxID=3060621 RepID=UPI003F673369